MIEFKLSVFTTSPSCASAPYARNEVVDRYNVYINEVLIGSAIQGITGSLNTFVANAPANTYVNVKVVDLTGELQTFNQSFLVYNNDLWFDIHLLYDTTGVGVVDYSCSQGIGQDYLQGSNYFSWEFRGSYTGSNNISVFPIIVELPRFYNQSGQPGQLVPFSSAWDNYALGVYEDLPVPGFIYLYWYTALFDTRIQGYESYYTAVGNRWQLGFTSPVRMYLIYLHQTAVVTQGGCCGGEGGSSIAVPCFLPFEISRSVSRDWEYCSAKFDIIDVPCSRDKWIYKTSTSSAPLKLEYLCDSVWKVIGEFGTSMKLQPELLCGFETLNIRVSCVYDGSGSTCCGGSGVVSEANACVELFTINSLPFCNVGEINLQQEVCAETEGCNDCGDFSSERLITQQNIDISSVVAWNNLVTRYYHKEEITAPKQYYKSTEVSVALHPNTTKYKIEKLDSFKLYQVVWESSLIIEGQPLTTLWTPETDGIYRFTVVFTNACMSNSFSKEVYIHAKSYVERIDCNKYRLYHCLDRSFDFLIRTYKDKTTIYSYTALTGVVQGSGASYNEDFNTYDFALSKDGVYEVLYREELYLILNDCFITTCHQEYVKALLCEGDICSTLLDNCKVTDDTLLKTYLIQKYVLLYDVYKALASKIINIEYNHLILPNVLLEENYCVDLYSLFDIIEKLKELCVTCKITTQTDDCGCH